MQHFGSLSYEGSDTREMRYGIVTFVFVVPCSRCSIWICILLVSHGRDIGLSRAFFDDCMESIMDMLYHEVTIFLVLSHCG